MEEQEFEPVRKIKEKKASTQDDLKNECEIMDDDQVYNMRKPQMDSENDENISESEENQVLEGEEEEADVRDSNE